MRIFFGSMAGTLLITGLTLLIRSVFVFPPFVCDCLIFCEYFESMPVLVLVQYDVYTENNMQAKSLVGQSDKLIIHIKAKLFIS